MRRRVAQIFVAGQGVYYLVTGLWPMISMASFEAVTGPKTDDWLVQTVGALVMAIGVTLLAGSRMWTRQGAVAVTCVLSVATAIAFAAVDVVFVSRGVIGPIYLADAAVEIVLVVVILASATRDGSD